MRRKPWLFSEKERLVENYKTSTIQELMKLLPERSPDSINAEIKRSKKAGKLKGYKDENVVTRSLTQRK